MNCSTQTSLLERIADKLGLNERFHKCQNDNINFDSSLIVSPVEAILTASGEIGDDGRIISKSRKEINLNEVIGESAHLFSGGFYLNFYLSPKNKHYWRIPYDSSLVSLKINEGKALIPVFIGMEKLLPGTDFLKKAIRKNASIGMFFQTEYFPFAMIPVGSLNVNGIHIVGEKDGDYKKGDIGGYFSIGSSMLLCFPEYTLDLLVNLGEKVDIGRGIVKIIRAGS